MSRRRLFAPETFRLDTKVGQVRKKVFHQTLEVEVVEESESGVFNVAFTQMPLKEIVPIKQNLSCLLKSYDTKGSQLQYKTMPFDESKATLSLTAVNDLQSIYFHNPKYEADLEQLMESVQLAAEHSDMFRGVIAQNEPCIAMCSFDIWVWFRAKVLNVLSENNTYLIEFVDYGTQEEVHHSEIRRIPKYFMDIPKYALKCCLWKHGGFDVPFHIIEEFGEDATTSGKFEVELIKSEDAPWEALVNFIDHRGMQLIERCVNKAKAIHRFEVALLSSSSDDGIEEKIKRFYVNEQQSWENSETNNLEEIIRDSSGEPGSSGPCNSKNNGNVQDFVSGDQSGFKAGSKKRKVTDKMEDRE